MARSITISRATTDLTIPGDGAGVVEGFWFEEFTPSRDVWRRSRVTADWLDGAPQVNAVLEASEIALLIHARSATPAGLATLRTELRSALHQWSFTLTYDEDGAPPVVYSCDCADIDPRQYKDPLVKSFAVTIPIPIPGA